MKEKDQTLLSILSEYQHFERLLVESGGELTPEAETEIESVSSKLITKVDACAYVMERLEVDERYYRDKAAQWTMVARAHANAAKRLKERVKYCMKELGATTLPGEDHVFKLTGGRFKTEIVDETMIPFEYFKEVIVREIDKELIETAIENGVDVPGVVRIEVQTLRIQTKKNEK